MSKKGFSKVIILGDTGVGKTSLLNSDTHHEFMNSYKPTVGAHFMYKQVIVDGKVINLEIWDTVSEEKFKSLRRGYYQGSDCCVLVYDITNKMSFDSIEFWMSEFFNEGCPKTPEQFRFIVIGNKIDKELEREVKEELVNEFVQKHPKIIHLKVSAKNSEDVRIGFETIALISIENKEEEISNEELNSLIPVSNTKLSVRKCSGNKRICC